MKTPIKIVFVLLLLLIGGYAADNVIIMSGSVMQKGAQGTPATIKATDNGDGTYTLAVGATFTPSGTQDVNLKQANGASVAVGHGVAATAIRVELPTDGTGTIVLPVGASTSALQTTGNASLVSLGNAFSNSFSNITTATTTTVKSGAGTLRSVTINSLGTVASVVTIYDNTAGSGTKIGTIDSLTLKGTFTFDAAFSTGLTIVSTGTLAPDITVSYR